MSQITMINQHVVSTVLIGLYQHLCDILNENQYLTGIINSR